MVTTPVEPIEEENAAIIAGLIICLIMARLRNNLEISLLMATHLIMKNQCLEVDEDTSAVDLNSKREGEIVATEEATKTATLEAEVVLQEEHVVVEIVDQITK